MSSECVQENVQNNLFFLRYTNFPTLQYGGIHFNTISRVTSAVPASLLYVTAVYRYIHTKQQQIHVAWYEIIVSTETGILVYRLHYNRYYIRMAKTTDISSILGVHTYHR